MTRRFLALSMGAVMLVALAAPASAHIQAFSIGVTSIGYESDTSFATGSITCTAGETWRVTLRVQQKSGYDARGADTGTCDGGPQNWDVQTTPSGDALQGEATSFFAVATTFANGVLDDRAKRQRIT